MAKAKVSKQFPAQAVAPPNLSMQEWNMTMVLGLVFIVMAVLQLIGFSEFRDALNEIGLSGASTWGAVLILGELWASAGLFKLKLSTLFRMFSSLFAVLVSGFWFFETIRLVSSDMTTITNNGFFGKFLMQSPGWWTVVEASVVLFWTFWAVSLTKPKSL